MIGGQETAKDLYSGIFIACSWVLASHSWEAILYILLSIFCCELLGVKLYNK